MAVPCQAPSWRFISSDLYTHTITVLDRIASDRHVEALLDVPNWLSFSVPSDSPLVNLTYTDDTFDDSSVAEGDRLIYAFRQEETTDLPYYVVRAAGISMQLEDSAGQDVARTTVTAWDPWKYAYFRPAQSEDGDLPAPTGTWDGKYLAGTTAEIVVLTQLLYTITNNGIIRIDAGDGSRIGEGAQYQDWGGTSSYAGTIEVCGALPDDFIVQQGQSVGDVWTAMVTAAYMDIVLTPIWDPVYRPGYTHEMNIYVQAGVDQPDDLFGWDTPPHSLIGLSRNFDGTTRANNVKFGAGQGASGGSAPVQTDTTSVDKYGEYWAQQFLPAAVDVATATQMAVWQLGLRKNGRQIVQFSPTPERSPCPFTEINLGDRVPVYAKQSAFRQELSGYLRIYGMPIDISDDALETVTGMILLPQVT